MSLSAEQRLAEFASTLEFAEIPEPVVRRCEALMLDWFGSALAGKAMRPVKTIESFAAAMGPQEGPSEVLVSRRSTSPLFAAMVNAASSHVAEQDDVHNGSVFHPAAVVFPPVLAVAQAIGASGQDLTAASVVGYEVGIRIGEFLGQPHYKVFHTTGTAGSLAAAAAVGRLLGLDPDKMLNAFGTAGTQAAGLWSSCAMRRIRSPCIPRTQRFRVSLLLILLATASPAQSRFLPERRRWGRECREMRIRAVLSIGSASAGCS